MTSIRSTPRTRGWRLTAASVMALTLSCGAVATSSMARADETPTPSVTQTPTPTPTPTTANGVSSLIVSPAEGGIFAPGTELTVTTRITHTGADQLPAGSLSLRISTTRLASSASITEWIENPAALTLVDIATTSVGAVGSDSSTDVEMTAPASTAALTGLQPGVYPVQVSHTSEAGTVTQNSVITIVGPTTPTVSVVTPFVSPSISRGVLSSDALAELTASDGRLAAALRVAQETNTIMAVDPAVLAAMRALGAAAPASVQSWLASYTALANDAIELPFADADLATLVAANRAELGPTSLTRYVDTAGFVAATPAPTPTGAPNPNVPSLETLTHVGGAHHDVAFPAAGSVTDALAQWAVTSGSTILVASEQVETIQPHVTLNDSGADAIVYNTELSDLLTSAASQSDAVIRGDDLAQAVAQASVVEGGRVVVAINRGAQLNPDAASATMSALSTVAGGRFAGLAVTSAQPPTGATLAPALEPTEHAVTLNSLLAEEAPLAEMAVVLADPSLLTGAERAEILQLFSATSLARNDWAKLVATHRTAVSETLTAIDIEPMSTIQFLSSGSTIPLRIRNDLPFDAELKLWAQPDDFRLTVESPHDVQAQGGAVTKVLLPVTASGNGDVTIRFSLTAAADGHPIGEPMYTNVLVRAEWEKFGIIGLVSITVLLMVGGTWRTIRKRRKARAAAEASSETGEDNDG